MATITKLKSGNYRIRKNIDGVTYSTTLTHKPTKREAEQLLFSMAEKGVERLGRTTFERAALDYAEARANILSPSTLREYARLLKTLPAGFRARPVAEIKTVDVQRFINTYAEHRSPKTVRNMAAYITVIIHSVRPKLELDIALPQRQRPRYYVPEDEDIRKILQAAAGTPYEVALKLAALGLRRSEICALTLDDIRGNTVSITKALVLDKNGKWVTKTTKTTGSTRTICIPSELADQIHKQGYVYKNEPASITHYLYRLQDKLGLPRFSVHKLRHYFASSAAALGIPQNYTMMLGGWSTPGVLNAVYTHTQQRAAEQASQNYLQHLDTLSS